MLVYYMTFSSITDSPTLVRCLVSSSPSSLDCYLLCCPLLGHSHPSSPALYEVVFYRTDPFPLRTSFFFLNVIVWFIYFDDQPDNARVALNESLATKSAGLRGAP